MKLQFKTSPTSSSGDMEVSKMGLADESRDLFAKFLRDQIYSNKILAPIREYICNAIDISIESNASNPVKVALTLEGSQYIWSCRDYGCGLDEEDVRNIFAMYGRSSKRDSNNQVGCFGVGSKSFFAYTDSYFVNSYYNGTLTKYVCMLGAGDNGVPVGEIYKVSEEPTKESGLEVSADVSKDYYEFDTETKQFIELFLPDANIQYTQRDGNLITPRTPLNVEEIGGFIFNRYEYNCERYNTYRSLQVGIRMGGVVYESNHRVKMPTPNGSIIVDVPIGKLSIPISRESLEMTPSNTKVFEAIQIALDTLSADDVKTLMVPNYAKDILSKNNNVENNVLGGVWFQYSFSNSFPDSNHFKKLIRKTSEYGATYDATDTGKYIVYLIPNIKSYKNWLTRLTKCLHDLGHNTNYYYVINNLLFESLKNGSETLDTSDCSFVDVKTLGLPRLKVGGPQVAYQVIHSNTKYGPWTCEELEDRIAQQYYNGDEIDANWYKSATNLKELHRRTIGLTSDCGGDNHFWVVNSKKLMQQMLDIGWIANNSSEYYTQRRNILDEEERQRHINNAASTLRSNIFYMKFAPRVIAAIGKNPEKLKRLSKIKECIVNEDSPRGRILTAMGNTYSSYTVERADMRKIMMLK